VHRRLTNSLLRQYLLGKVPRFWIMTARDAQHSWDRFLDTYDPLRSELYRYVAGELGVAVRVNGHRTFRMGNS